MNTPVNTKAVTAAEAMAKNAREVFQRTEVARNAILVGTHDPLTFYFEMIRESARSLEFWMQQIEAAVSNDA